MESLQTINSETNDLQEEEIKAEEKLNQRREARRRKILENAKNRLERLNGRITTNTTTINSPTLDSTTTTSDSFDGTHVHQHINGPNHLSNGEFSDPEVEPDIIPLQMPQNEPLIMGNIFNSLNAETTTTPQQKRHILLRARVHLILSALVACILTFILRDTNSSGSISYSVFIPAGLCVVIDLLFFREQQPLNPMINMVLALCNIRLPSQTQNILHVISIIQSLFVDLGVFIFSFCIFSCSLVCINYRFTDLIAIK